MFILYGDYRVNLVSTTTDGDLVVPRVQQPSTQRAKSYLVLRSSAGLCIWGSDSRTIATNSSCLRCVSSWWLFLRQITRCASPQRETDCAVTHLTTLGLVPSPVSSKELILLTKDDVTWELEVGAIALPSTLALHDNSCRGCAPVSSGPSG